MSLLDKIVFIADYMEANRNQAEDLPEVRALAFKDLDACLRLILEDTIAYLAKKKSVTDPMSPPEEVGVFSTEIKISYFRQCLKNQYSRLIRQL